ncbi:hypothetical protein [Abyssisolibacter fermentans]|uniref:hypothetical protein n=1 Tax=Abyssisolibacter fermentans TaxID=1766203 RepID=UPI0008335082|nr:hypothetical protein [Abyssisolibacter fermentans]
MKEVEIIKPKKNKSDRTTGKEVSVIRVAPYCRVSTGCPKKKPLGVKKVFIRPKSSGFNFLLFKELKLTISDCPILINRQENNYRIHYIYKL